MANRLTCIHRRTTFDRMMPRRSFANNISSNCRRRERDTNGPQELQGQRLVEDTPGSLAASHQTITGETHQVAISFPSTSDASTTVVPRPVTLSTPNAISLEALFPYLVPGHIANQSQTPPLHQESTSLQSDHSDPPQFHQETQEYELQDLPQNHPFEPHDFYDAHPQDANLIATRQQYLEHQYYEQYDHHQMDYDDEPGFIDEHQRARLELLSTIESALAVVEDCDEERDHNVAQLWQHHDGFHRVGADFTQ